MSKKLRAKNKHKKKPSSPFLDVYNPSVADESLEHVNLRRLGQFVQDHLREAISPFVGEVMTPSIRAAMRQNVLNYLNEMERRGIISEWAEGPTLDNGGMNITFSSSPAGYSYISMDVNLER